MTKYKWLLFDADNTLFDFEHASKLAFADLMEKLGLGHLPQPYHVYQPINQAAWKKFENGKINTQELRISRFKDFFDALGIYEDPVFSNRYYLSRMIEHTKLYDTTLEMLRQLRSKYKMLIITNGLKDVQRARIDKFDLHSFFEYIVISDEIGHFKPHNAYFQYTLQLIDSPPKQNLLVIGDSLHSDIKGGNDFGMDTCWFNPQQKQNLTDIQPTFEVDSHKTLAHLLTK